MKCIFEEFICKHKLLLIKTCLDLQSYPYNRPLLISIFREKRISPKEFQKYDKNLELSYLSLQKKNFYG